MLIPLFGLPGIEPGLHPPHGRVLPVYYSPLPLHLSYLQVADEAATARKCRKCLCIMLR